MHAVQIVSVPAGATARFSPRTSQPSFSGPQSRPDEQPVPQWLKEFGLCFATNMALGWEAPCRLQLLFKSQPNISQQTVLTVLEQLFAANHQEEERKAHLRRQVARLLDHPRLFQHTPFGQQEAVSFFSSITEGNTTWQMLERAYPWLYYTAYSYPVTYLDYVFLLQRLDREELFTDGAYRLYMKLVDTANPGGGKPWPVEFVKADPWVAEMCRCSVNPMKARRDELKRRGLIWFDPGGAGRGVTTKYRLLDGKKVSESDTLPGIMVSDSDTLRLEKAGKVSEKVSGKVSESDTPCIEYKKEEKMNTARRAVSALHSFAKNDVASDVSFELFWDAFAKKVDRVKSEKAWAKLTQAHRLEAFAKVPAYVADTPELRYRKNPLTWLTGQCWRDERDPAAEERAAPGYSAAPNSSPRPVNSNSVLDPEAVAANAAAAQTAMHQRIVDRQQRQVPA